MRMSKELLVSLDAADGRISFLSEIKSGTIEYTRLEKLVQVICDAPEIGPIEIANKDISYIMSLLHVVHFSSKKDGWYDDRKSSKLDELFSLLAIELSVHFQ